MNEPKQSFDLQQLVQVGDDEVAAEGEAVVEEAAPAVEEGAEVAAETTEVAETVAEEVAPTEAVVPLQTMIDANGLTLTIGKYAFELNGLFYVPNSAALIKDGMVFLPFPGAVKDEVSGNYFTDANLLTMLSEVVIKDDKIYALEINGEVLLSPEDGITQIPYT